MIALDVAMPESCFGCQFEGCNKDGWSVCKLKEDIDTNPHERPAACPLREVQTIEKKSKLPKVMFEGSNEDARFFASDIACALCEKNLVDLTYSRGELIERFTVDGITQEKILGKPLIVTGRVMVVAPQSGGATGGRGDDKCE